MNILGIETSCDDTGVAIYNSQKGLLAHALFSQIELHSEYGGVVPELAARDHIRKVLPLVNAVLQQSGLDKSEIDGVAYTAGPGLAGALLAGSAVAKGLAFGLEVPSLGVHHMEAHMLAPMLEENAPEFPFVALLVSGGHTLLAEVRGIGQYKILGQSLDDAVGEAFDKTAKILSLGYPGGPAIAQIAENANLERFNFPRPMLDRPGLDFSFSGLKTHALVTAQKYLQKDLSKHEKAQTIADIAGAFQSAAVQTLVKKSERAITQVSASRLVVAGGVGANRLLRQELEQSTRALNARVYYPKPEFCTDNGAMIALLGALRVRQMHKDDAFQVKPRWSIEDLPPL